MKRLYGVAVALSIALGCGGDPPASKGAAAPSQGDLVATYVSVQETLADDSVDKLAELGAQIVVSAEPLQATPGIAEVQVGAGRIASPDIETARVGFEKMSMGLITYLKAHPEERGSLEVIHCTMAFNNKGAYWVQRAGEVNNPYHGKMMLRCGDHVDWDEAPG